MTVFQSSIKSTMQITAWLIGACLLSLARGECPASCACRLDPVAKNMVSCGAGGLKELSFLSYIDINTQILVVDAPEWYPNHLTIGPIFRRFRAFLEEITIRHSAVPAIGENSFFGLRALRRLDLSHNNITYLAHSNFKGLALLRRLYLSHNQIKSAPSACFRWLDNLQLLDLSHNRLAQLTARLLMRLGRLKQLVLNHNQLRELPVSVLADVPLLRHLACSHCQLSNVSDKLYQTLPHLEHLDFSYNQLSSLRHNEFWHLQKLRFLDMSGNHLSSLDGRPFLRMSFDSLLLSRNRLVDIADDAFDNMTAVSLDLSYNRISQLASGVLSPLSVHLESLSLAGNRLDAVLLQPTLLEVPAVRHLNLAEAGLLAVSDTLLAVLPHLQALNVSGNHLLTLPASLLRPLASLRRLDVSGNQLTGLDQDTVNVLESMEQVRLKNNQWTCDQCHLPPLLGWIHREEAFRDACAELRWESCLRCSQPASMRRREIPLLNISLLPACNDEVDKGTRLDQRCRDIDLLVSDASLRQLCYEHGGDVSAATASEESSDLQLSWRRSVTAAAVMAACAVTLALLIVLVMTAMVVLRRRHSAVYYTHEDDERRSCVANDAGVDGSCSEDSADVNRNNHNIISGDGKKVRIDASSKLVSGKGATFV